MLTRISLVLFTLLFSGAGLRGQTRTATDTRVLTLPAPGDWTLHILSPTLLELTQISARARDVDPGRVATALEVRVGGQPVKIARAGWKRRPISAPLATPKDVRIATQVYLRLAAPLALDAKPLRVEVRDAKGALGKSGATWTASADPRRYSPAIHVNQEGYVPALPKKAMIGYYLGDLGEMPVAAAAGFTIVDAKTGGEKFRGPLTPRPDVGYKTTPLPYQDVLVADFSEFKTPGEYQLQIAGLGASLPFLIHEGIAMGFARTYALGLFHQRCGAEVKLPFTRYAHAACHLAPARIPSPQSDDRFDFTWKKIAAYADLPSPDNPAQTAPKLSRESAQLYPLVKQGAIDVSGGHHDAGDYSKYTINSAELVHYLIFAVDSIAGVAEMDNLGIPESGDGIPDILQEAKWESDFLAKLQDTDGGFYFLVYPQTREYESGVLPEHGDPQVVWPKNTAVTAAAVAALAQCASSPQFKKHYPEVAAKYLKQAQLGWQFLMRAIAKHGKAGAYQKITFYGDHFTHADELVWAACELYLATGEPQYGEKLAEWLPNPAHPSTYRWGWWKMSEAWGNAIRSYAFAARSGRVPAGALDARYLKICEGQVLSAGDDALMWSRKNAYATPFPIQTKVVRGGGWYFSLDQASDMAVAYQLDPKPEYIDALVGAMNFEGGGNPVNVTFLTGLGTRRQREIVSQYAQNDRRILPPAGIPIGNIQTTFSRADLQALTYPRDDAVKDAYAFYDRWSDAFNVSTEFITVNQARGFLASAVLAAQTPAASRPWTPVRAQIEMPSAMVRLNEPLTFHVHVEGRDLADARIVWEANEQEPAFGRSYTIAPKTNGAQWVEAEVQWPDGQRAFAAGSFGADSPLVTWIEDALPAGAKPGSSGGDGWNWVKASPAPHAGTLAHQSNLARGLHEHWFEGATATLSLSAGDTLFAWVWLDPEHPPREIMLMWHDGSSWEHRAYWGANLITYGKDRSASRHYAGALPPAGRWVRLEVPARAVGLEGAVISGMGFSQVDGQVTWDGAGRAAAKTGEARPRS